MSFIAPFYVEFDDDNDFITVLNMLQGGFPTYAAPTVEGKTLEEIECELENK